MAGLKNSFLLATDRTACSRSASAQSFKQVALSAGRQGAHQEGLVAVHAQHDDAHVGIALDDLRGGIDAVELRHGDIHHHHVRRKLLGEPDRFAAIGGFTDYFDGWVRVQKELEALADDAVIIGNEHFGGVRHNAQLYRKYRQAGGRIPA